MAKRVTLTKKDGEKVYPRTYTKLVQNGDGEILDNIMLTSAKILPFSGYEVGLNDASLEAVAPSGYTINYNRSRNRFFAVVGNVNYSNWGNAEQLLYNRANNAREDNVYIHSNGNICVIQNGSMTTVSTVGTQLAEVKADIDAFLLDADASSAAIDTLKEIQSYIDSDKESAAVMLASIQANATAITAEKERAKAAEGALHEKLTELSDKIGLSNTITATSGTVYSNVISYSAKAGELLIISVYGDSGIISGNLQITDNNFNVIGFVTVGNQLEVTLSKDITYIKAERAASSVIGNGDITLNVKLKDTIDYRINKIAENVTNNTSSIGKLDDLVVGEVANSSIEAVSGTVYSNTVNYSASAGDRISVRVEGEEGIISGTGQISDNKFNVLGYASVGDMIDIELIEDITFIKFERAASGVVGNGVLTLSVSKSNTLTNRISKAEKEIDDISIEMESMKMDLSETKDTIDNITGNKASSTISAIAGNVYRNTLYYTGEVGTTLLITLSGDATLINGYGQVSDNNFNVLGSLAIGKSLIVTLERDITWIRFERSASNVVGDGELTLSAELTESLNFRIFNNEEDIKQIKEVLGESSFSEDIIVAASAYDARIRAREEYLRDTYKNSGESEHWYGAEWTEESADNVTAINSDGDILLHTSLPIQNKMKRCIVKDGIVQYYLDADNSELKEDGSAASLDGTDGNVMVELPEFFYRAEEDITDGIRTIRLKISEQGLNGFIFSPKRYTSAYEATLDRSKNKLVSVCTTLFERSTEEIFTELTSYIVGSELSRGIHKTARRSGFVANAANYRGGVNDATLDNETDTSSQNYSRNQLGIPIANVNRTQCRSYVDNLIREFIYQYDTHKILWMFSMVEFKKKDVTKGADMSIGANVYPDYNAYEAYFSPQGGISCLPCGITNSLGNKTGTVYYRMVNVPVASTGSSSSIIYNRWSDVWMPCLSYRGVEHWFGHTYKIADGVNILCEGTGTYYEGKEGNANYEYNNVTYWYQKNPYLTNDKGIENQKLGTFNYLSGTQVITSLLGGSKMHILPISADVTGYSTHYCDSVEIYHRGGMMYPAYNGRIVSGSLDGANFIVGNNLADNGTPRPSDGTRLDIL